MTPRQKEALARYKHQGTWSIAQSENYDGFWKWFGFINDLFFGGLLTGFCRIDILEHRSWMQVRATASTMAYSDWYLPGQGRDPRYNLEAPYCLIAFASSGDRDPTVRIQHYIRVMCLELLHKYIPNLHLCLSTWSGQEMESGA
jgi:hypothetical protein